MKNKIIFIIPVYNELENLKKYIENFLIQFNIPSNFLIFIDDGSHDKSQDLLNKKLKDNFIILHNETNQGLGKALKKGFDYATGLIDFFDYDYIVTIDSDFQHNYLLMKNYIKKMQKNKIDCLFIRRDLSNYPLIKILGNYFFSGWTSVLLQKRFFDVETGFRIFTPESLEIINSKYIGYRYSCAQEIAVISVMSGLEINNRQKCKLNHVRSNTSLKDVFINLYISIKTYMSLK